MCAHTMSSSGWGADSGAKKQTMSKKVLPIRSPAALTSQVCAPALGGGSAAYRECEEEVRHEVRIRLSRPCVLILVALASLIPVS